jgi:hypothetical protein
MKRKRDCVKRSHIKGRERRRIDGAIGLLRGVQMRRQEFIIGVHRQGFRPEQRRQPRQPAACTDEGGRALDYRCLNAEVSLWREMVRQVHHAGNPFEE